MEAPAYREGERTVTDHASMCPLDRGGNVVTCGRDGRRNGRVLGAHQRDELGRRAQIEVGVLLIQCLDQRVGERDQLVGCEIG